MDTTLRFYNYPSLFDRAILADARKDWEWHQFSIRESSTTGGPMFRSTYGKCTLREKIADWLCLAVHNFHTDEMLNQVENACYEYHPELIKLDYREPTPFDNLFEDNPKFEFVPHERYYDSMGPCGDPDDDDLPF